MFSWLMVLVKLSRAARRTRSTPINKATLSATDTSVSALVKRRLASEGARVACLDINATAAAETAQTVAGGARSYAVDVSDRFVNELDTTNSGGVALNTVQAGTGNIEIVSARSITDQTADAAIVCTR